MTMSDVIEAIYKAGKPLVIASDVHDMPFSVEKIRRAFNGVAFSPRQDMSVETKLDLTADFSYQNDHERDALAAALEAFRSYRNKFQNLLRRVPPGYDLDEVRAGIVRGQALEQVLSDLKGKTVTERPESPKIEEPSPIDERIRILDGTVKRLKSIVQELQEELQQRDHEIIRLQTRVKRVRSQQDEKIRKDAELIRRDAVIGSLKRRLRKEEKTSRKLRKQVEVIKAHEEAEPEGEMVPVKILSSLTREGVRALSDEFGIREGDILFVPRIDVWGANAGRELVQLGIDSLVVKTGGPTRIDPQLEALFREAGIPLLSSRGMNVVMTGGIAYISRDDLDQALKTWEEGQKEYERLKKESLLEDIFREYRTERGKEVKKVG
jgi:hypothetical protein